MKMEEILQKHPNPFDGDSFTLTNPADIEHLDPRAAILLEPGQIAFFKDLPKSLEGLVKMLTPLTQIPTWKNGWDLCRTTPSW